MNSRLWLSALAIALFLPAGVCATSNYEYKPDEYVTVTDGRSPDGKYSIAAHGEGELGDENFHLYLMNAETGKKIADGESAHQKCEHSK